MSQGDRKFPTARRGAVTRTKVGGKEEEVNPKREERGIKSLADTPYASVGLSLSTGASTEYAREKYEISAWCTLPCAPDSESIRASYAECFDYVSSEIDSRVDSVEKAAFQRRSR